MNASYTVIAVTKDHRDKYIGRTPNAKQADTMCKNAVKLGYLYAYSIRTDCYGTCYYYHYEHQ